jgi:hypothetical protein
MNIQDNYAKTWDGMFTRVSPRLDAVEEVPARDDAEDGFPLADETDLLIRLAEAGEDLADGLLGARRGDGTNERGPVALAGVGEQIPGDEVADGAALLG